MIAAFLHIIWKAIRERSKERKKWLKRDKLQECESENAGGAKQTQKGEGKEKERERFIGELHWIS